MVIGSHNSWSFLKGKHWWQNALRFVAQCQDVDIQTQYEKYGVRFFDLRVRYDKNGNTVFAHGKFEYNYNLEKMSRDLQYIDGKGDCYIRILHEARTLEDYTLVNIERFKAFCSALESTLPHTVLCNGRNVYNGEVDYQFKKQEPSCLELYSSVCAPKLIDDWCPRIYAKTHNKENVKKGTDREVLLIDFVNYQ